MVSVDVKLAPCLLTPQRGQVSRFGPAVTMVLKRMTSVHGSAWFKQANKQTNVIISKSIPTDNNRMCLGASDK